MTNSYTSISYLFNKTSGKRSYSPSGKEIESKRVDPKKAESIPELEEVGEKQEQAKSSESSNQVAQPQVEIIPDLPEIDQDLLDDGIEITDYNTIFVRNRKIELPLSLEKVDEGLHKPLTSGLRWLSEITKLILAKFHLILKKVGGKLKIIEKS